MWTSSFASSTKGARFQKCVILVVLALGPASDLIRKFTCISLLPLQIGSLHSPQPISMRASLCLPLQASTRGGGPAAPSSSSCSASLPRLCAASSSQLWRSHQLWRPPPRRRAPRRVFVCETAVEIDGIPSTEGVDEPTPAIGSRIRVSIPLKVFHVPKHPEFELQGHEGELKDVLKSWKGKPLSANLPYKVQFVLDLEGKKVKFFTHLKDDEFEVI